MTLKSFLSDVEDGSSSTHSRDRWNAMSTGQRDRLRLFLESDSYAFTHIIGGHADLVPELHMPLSYMVCGLTDKLIFSISQSGFDSYVTREIRKQLWDREIRFDTPEGREQVDQCLNLINIRWFRGSYKSSTCTHGGATFMATLDPNETIKITTAIDDKAWELCEQIGKTILSGVYNDIFPDRVPTGDTKKSITMKTIELAGRTGSHPQTTINAFGYRTKDIGAHYSTFIFDDLVVGGPGGNATTAELPGVHAHLRGLSGYYMNTRRIRRVHVGTKWDENDDDAFLTSGKLAKSCLTIRVPIEEYDHPVENLSERGKPTIPQIKDEKKIQALFDETITSETGLGAWEWRCNYLLDVSAGGGRLFSQALVDDPERAYKLVPLPLDQVARRRLGHQLVSRFARTSEGVRIEVNGWNGAPDDPSRWTRLIMDPWKHMDRVLTLDPSWSKGADNWACSCTGDDHFAVRYQLETQSGDGGLDEWVDALPEMVEFWKPRIIGFDKNAMQDAMIANMLKTDRRLRKIRHLFVGISAKNLTKYSRINAFVAEPLKMYRLLLHPTDAESRAEMVAYKGDKKAVDGILDSLAMAQAVHVKRTSPEQREELMARLKARNAAIEASIDPYTGIPFAA